MSKAPQWQAQTPRISEVFGWPIPAVLLALFNGHLARSTSDTEKGSNPQRFRLASYFNALTRTATACTLKAPPRAFLMCQFPTRNILAETKRRRSRYLPQRTFLVPSVHRLKPLHPFKRRAAVHRLSSDSLVPPWPLCPALLRRPVEKATVFALAHPATAACAANHKSQRRHWRLADSDDALTWLSPLSRAQFLPRDGVK